MRLIDQEITEILKILNTSFCISIFKITPKILLFLIRNFLNTTDPTMTQWSSRTGMIGREITDLLKKGGTLSNLFTR